MLAEFNSVVAAVQWTADLRRQLQERRLHGPVRELFQIRAGIVLVAGNDLDGSGINLAVRMQNHSPPPPPPSNRPSVVVLRFDNLSGDADQSYVADAVVEEIPATLSRMKDVCVIARAQAAAACAERGLHLAPNHVWAWMRHGFGQVYLGNPEKE